MRESTVEKHLLKQMKRLGIEVRKVKWIGRAHAPDRLVMFDGGIWVELKAPGKRPRPGQVREHMRMRAAGLKVHVLDTLSGVDVFAYELELKLCLYSRLENTKS